MSHTHETLTSCGCAAVLSPGGQSIRYCPLHAAAPALVAALVNAEIELRNIHRDMLARDEHAPTGCPCTADSGESCAVDRTLTEIEAALAAAKGE